MLVLKQAFSRGDSLAVKGIAVMMLLFHHLYSALERFDSYPVSFFPFAQDDVVAVALMSKNCVSLFAFISGYGLLKSIASIPLNRRSVLIWNITRLLKLLSGFWFIYALVFVVSLCLDGLPIKTYFESSSVAGLCYLLNDFFGLANFFDTPTMNSTWWYMSAAILYVLLVPLLYLFVRRIGYLPVLAATAALPRLLNSDYPGGMDPYSFLLSILFGMLFAQYDVFGRIERRFPADNPRGYLLHFVVWGALVVLAYQISRNYGHTEAWELNLGVLPLAFLCFFRFCVIRIPGLRQVLRFLGRHSMTIFLIHTFIQFTYLEDFVYSFKNFALIFLVLLALSLAFSILLDGLRKLCRYDRLIDALLHRITKKLAA